MNGLSCGEESLTIYSAVLIQCQRVTDRRTDGQTDVQPISITCFNIADARKNGNERHKLLIQKCSLSFLSLANLANSYDSKVCCNYCKTLLHMFYTAKLLIHWISIVCLLFVCNICII